MRSSGRCPKCESTEIVRNARVRDRNRSVFHSDLEAQSYDKPDALIFKGATFYVLSACICRRCGFTELYAS